MFKNRDLFLIIIALTILGIVSQQQTPSPNQEIVLQFTNQQVAVNDIHCALSDLKNQLKQLGAKNICVKQVEPDVLKITYYSTTDVANIKEIFSKENNFFLDFSSHHKHGQEVDLGVETHPYALDVYEINHTNDLDSNSKGIELIEFGVNSDRFFKPQVFSFVTFTSQSKDEYLLNQILKVNKKKLFKTKKLSQKIPQVRAGPIS